MNALTSPEVRDLHALATADVRLGKPARLILADIARTGREGNANHLATVGQINRADVPAVVAKLRTLGYLPSVTK